MGVIAGLTEKWSKTKTMEVRNCHGAPLEKSSPQLIHTIVESLLQQCSTLIGLEKSLGADALSTRGTKRQNIPAPIDVLCLFVSASVEMSPSPKLAFGTSAVPEKQQR